MLPMNFDATWTEKINSLVNRQPIVDSFFVFITSFGHYLLVGLIALRWFAKEANKRNRLLAIQCGLSTALALLVNQIILLFVQRTRPYELGLTRLLVEKSADPSFPSDHATIAAAICAALFLQKDKWFAYFLFFSGLLCFSRVFVGTHYLGDVIGGVGTGIIGAWIAKRSYRFWLPLCEPLLNFPRWTRSTKVDGQ